MGRSTKGYIRHQDVDISHIRDIVNSDSGNVPLQDVNFGKIFDNIVETEKSDLYGAFINGDGEDNVAPATRDIPTDYSSIDPPVPGESDSEKLNNVITQSTGYDLGDLRGYGGQELDVGTEGIPEIYWANAITISGGECIPTGDLLDFFIENNLYPEINILPDADKITTYVDQEKVSNYNLSSTTQSAYYREGVDSIYNSNLATKVGIDYPNGQCGLPEFQVKVTPRLKDLNTSIHLSEGEGRACPVNYGFADSLAMVGFYELLSSISDFVFATELSTGTWSYNTYALGQVTIEELISGIKLPTFTGDGASGINEATGLMYDKAIIVSNEFGLGLTYVLPILQGISYFIGMILFADAIWDAINQPADVVNYPYQYQNIIYGIYTFEDVALSKYKIGAGTKGYYNRNYEETFIVENGTTHSYTLNDPNFGTVYSPTNMIERFPNNDINERYLNFEFLPECYQYDYNTPPPIMEYVVELIPIRNCKLSTTKITKFVVSIPPDKYLAPKFEVITPSFKKELYTNTTATFKNAKYCDFLYLADKTNLGSGILGELFGDYYNVTVNSDGNEEYHRNKFKSLDGRDITMSGQELLGQNIFGSWKYPNADDYTVNFMMESEPNMVFNPYFRIEKNDEIGSRDADMRKYWYKNSNVEISKGVAYCSGGEGNLYQQILNIYTTSNVDNYYLLTLECSGNVSLKTTDYCFDYGVYAYDALTDGDRIQLTQDTINQGHLYNPSDLVIPPESQITFDDVNSRIQFTTGYWKVILKRKNTTLSDYQKYLYFVMEDGSSITTCKLQRLPNSKAGNTNRGCYNAITQYNQSPQILKWKGGPLMSKMMYILFSGESGVYTFTLGLSSNIESININWFYSNGDIGEDNYTITNETSLVISKNALLIPIKFASISITFSDYTLIDGLTSFVSDDNKLVDILDLYGLLSNVDLNISSTGINKGFIFTPLDIQMMRGVEYWPQYSGTIYYSFTRHGYKLNSLNVSDNENFNDNVSNITSVKESINLNNTSVEGTLAPLMAIPIVNADNTLITSYGNGDVMYKLTDEPHIVWKNDIELIDVKSLNRLLYNLDLSGTENGYLDISGANPDIVSTTALDNINSLVGTKNWNILFNINGTQVDTSIPPTIELIGGNIDLYIGQSYIELGATAIDCLGNDISNDVVITGYVGTTVGTYNIEYNVTDSFGNNAEEVIRLVNMLSDEVTIGTQTWKVRNLDIDDGLGGVYAYDDNESNVPIYGRLYTLDAAMRIANSVSGWHLPSDAEWTTLTTYLGGTSVAGGKLKETGTTHWNSPNLGATNESGFTALPGGIKPASASFNYIWSNAFLWSSTEGIAEQAYYRVAYYNNSRLDRGNGSYLSGMSVRLIKDYSHTPTITMLDDSPIILNVGDTYTDAGATAYDERYGDITSRIVTVNNVNTAVAGNYTVTYNVTTEDGYSAIEVVRNVTIQVNPYVMSMTTTSTSSTWSPQTVTKTGATLHWEVTGAVTTSADINKPTFDFSTAGTKYITVTASDGASGLTYFNTYSTQLTSLDVSSCINLLTLSCYGQNNMLTLDVSNNINLIYLNIGYTKITSINLNNNINLQTLYCQNTSLTSLNIDNNINLKFLQCTTIKAKTINFSNNINLEQLICSNLTYLDITNNTKLSTIYASNCNVSSIDLTEYTNLRSFAMPNNHLTHLDFYNTGIYSIDISNNQLSYLNVSNISTLQRLYCNYNLLTNLIIPLNSPEFYVFYCDNNQLPTAQINDFMTYLLTLESNGIGEFKCQTQTPPASPDINKINALRALGWIVQY